MYVERNVVVRSCNHFCGGKATMLSLSDVELHVTAKCTKIFSAAQKCFEGKFVLPVTMKILRNSF